mgnify:CR=1 FL=1|tara:strand:+ start:385 stop:606 length:222 start_codon:yes stop_codon:yes gene_type:complete
MSKDNWIKDPLSGKEAEKRELAAKDISKAALVHKIETLMDELKVITQERDTLSKENERLAEENSNILIVKGNK